MPSTWRAHCWRAPVVSIGWNQHPRASWRRGAAALILVHNHPSGDPTPSAEDRSVTERLARAGEILGVRVLDHVVVAERGYVSLREEGVLDGSDPIVSPKESAPSRR